MANESLSAAKAAKNDEFYTQYYDIEREINAYLEFDPDVFRGKTVLLPCDDPEWSNFTAYKKKAEKMGYKGNYSRLGNSCWFSNLEHGRRHQPLSLMTMEENICITNIRILEERVMQNMTITMQLRYHTPMPSLQIMMVRWAFQSLS